MKLQALLAGLLLVPAVAAAQPWDPDRWTDVHGWDDWWDEPYGPVVVVVPRGAAGVPALPDGTWVTLTGRVVGRVGDDDLLFVDDTGAVVLDIDSPLWAGDFRRGMTVTVAGEVDWNFDDVEIDVRSIQAVG